MAESVDLIKKAKNRGWTDAEIAAAIKVSTKSVENWAKGLFNPHSDKLQKLREIANAEPSRSDARDESMDTLLLRVQNIVLNLEAREKANAEMLKSIYRQQTRKNRTEVEQIYRKLLSGFLTGALSDQQIIDIESL